MAVAKRLTHHFSTPRDTATPPRRTCPDLQQAAVDRGEGRVVAERLTIHLQRSRNSGSASSYLCRQQHAELVEQQRPPLGTHRHPLKQRLPIRRQPLPRLSVTRWLSSPCPTLRSSPRRSFACRRAREALGIARVSRRRPWRWSQSPQKRRQTMRLRGRQLQSTAWHRAPGVESASHSIHARLSGTGVPPRREHKARVADGSDGELEDDIPVDSAPFAAHIANPMLVLAEDVEPHVDGRWVGLLICKASLDCGEQVGKAVLARMRYEGGRHTNKGATALNRSRQHAAGTPRVSLRRAR